MTQEHAKAQKVAVLGLGYVGCVSAACFADIGHTVLGVDRDEHKVRSVNDGVAPFYEPGLEEVVRANRNAGRLSATTTLIEGIADADVALICVGTPSERNGNMSLEQLRRVVDEIAAAMPSRSKPLIVAVRSTVFPGTCEEVVLPVLGAFPHCQVVSNPEFLREGQAMKDFMQPSLVVVGGDRAASETVASLYDPLGVPPCIVSLRTAEMIKYSCNAFHALKIAFANEIGSLCARNGISASEVMDTLCQDVRLNISPAYLKPGFAFGGSCLPKDLRALSYRASRQDLKLPLLESILPSNDEHLSRAIRALLDSSVRRIGVFGLAFKENTDDLRESPVVTMVEQLVGKGRDVSIYDPHIQLERIYGTNRNFILKAIPHIERLIASSLDDLLQTVDCVVLTQKPAPANAARIEASGVKVIDLTRVETSKEQLVHTVP